MSRARPALETNEEATDLEVNLLDRYEAARWDVNTAEQKFDQPVAATDCCDDDLAYAL